MSEDEFNAMLSEGLFSVLINTVYFKAAWQNQFTPQSTYRSVFTDRNGKETETDFMLDVSYYDCYCRKKYILVLDKQRIIWYNNCCVQQCWRSSVGRALHW